MSDFLNAKLEKEKKIKQRNARGMKIMLIVMALGFAFFLTSKLYFPAIHGNVSEIAGIGTELECGDYLFSLDAWDYSKRDKAFEVIFDMTNLSLDEEAKVSFACWEGQTLYPSAIYRASPDMLVIRITHVPRNWRQVDLVVYADDTSKEIRMNADNVHGVEQLVDRTDDEYAVYACQSKIVGIDAALASLKQDMENKKEEIDITYSRLEELTAKKATQTESEKAQTDEGIKKMSEKQRGLQNEMEDMVLQQKELTEKREGQAALLEKLGGDVS